MEMDPHRGDRETYRKIGFKIGNIKRKDLFKIMILIAHLASSVVGSNGMPVIKLHCKGLKSRI